MIKIFHIKRNTLTDIQRPLVSKTGVFPGAKVIFSATYINHGIITVAESLRMIIASS